MNNVVTFCTWVKIIMDSPPLAADQHFVLVAFKQTLLKLGLQTRLLRPCRRINQTQIGITSNSLF